MELALPSAYRACPLNMGSNTSLPAGAFLMGHFKGLGKREMFGGQTPLNTFWSPNILPFEHLVWCCLVVFDKI